MISQAFRFEMTFLAKTHENYMEHLTKIQISAERVRPSDKMVSNCVTVKLCVIKIMQNVIKPKKNSEREE